MRQDVKIREKLTVYVKDADGNIISKEEYKPPRNKLEEIASKLGILKRANTVNTSGFHVAAARLVGTTHLPVAWVGVKYSGIANSWLFRAADVEVVNNTAIVRNPDNTFPGSAGDPGLFEQVCGATSNHWQQIISTIDCEIKLQDATAKLWVEIEYDFS